MQLAGDGGGLTIPPADLVVRVTVHDRRSGADRDLGVARDALHDRSLSKGDRTAVANAVAAVAYVQGRFGYSVDAGGGQVVVQLHADHGPSEGDGTISVPPSNAFSGFPAPGLKLRDDGLLPDDAAHHELIHVLQERLTGTQVGGHMPQPLVGTPRGEVGISSGGFNSNDDISAVSVAEGIADAGVALATGDWRIGEGFFAAGSTITSARDYDQPWTKSAAAGLRTDYSKVRHRRSDPHVEGGVVGATLHELARRTSRATAEQVLWDVLRDPKFARSRQDWRAFADALKRQAEAKPELQDAMRASLASTHLDDALSSPMSIPRPRPGRPGMR